MGIFSLILLAVGLSMDAFAVSVCKGLSVSRAGKKEMLLCGVWFGGFQALMPLIGFLVGSVFAELIAAVDHWIAFGLLALIGGNMIRESFIDDDGGDNGNGADFSARVMLTMAIATSIDALAVGISLSMAGNVNILAAFALIGLITFSLSAAGVKVGSIFGSRFEKRAEIAGGLILIFLGIKILLEHLNII